MYARMYVSICVRKNVPGTVQFFRAPIQTPQPTSVMQQNTNHECI